jgi:hypothetical protein
MCTICGQLNQLYVAFAMIVLIFTAFSIYLVQKDFNVDANNIYDAFWLIRYNWINI